MGNGKVEVIEIEDSFLASAFILQKDLISSVIPFLKSNYPPRVAFRVTGNIEEASNRISSNCTVGCRDFIQAAKGLRSSIFFLKNFAGAKR